MKKLLFLFFIFRGTHLTVHSLKIDETMKSKTNHHLMVAAEQWLPHVTLKRVNDSWIAGGPMGNLLEVISAKIGFSYTIVQPPDHVWGAPNADGNWSGMIGLVNRSEIDMALGPFTSTWTRSQAVKLSHPLLIDSQRVFMERPGLTVDIYSFLKPFRPLTYLAIGMTILTISIFFKLTIGKTSRTVSMLWSLLWALRVFTQNSYDCTFKSSSNKLVVMSWLLGSLILMKAYSGILTSMLTVPLMIVPIDSIEDLAKQDDIPWRIEKDTATYYSFQNSESPVWQTIFSGKIGTFYDCFSSCDDIRTGKFAAICDFSTIQKCMHYDFSQSGRCNTYSAQEPVDNFGLFSMIFKKGSPMSAEVDYWVMRVSASGLYDKWVRDELVNATNCLVPPSSDSRNSGSLVLTLNHFTGVFFMFICANIIGVVIFAVEVISGKVFNKK